MQIVSCPECGTLLKCILKQDGTVQCPMCGALVPFKCSTTAWEKVVADKAARAEMSIRRRWLLRWFGIPLFVAVAGLLVYLGLDRWHFPPFYARQSLAVAKQAGLELRAGERYENPPSYWCNLRSNPRVFLVLRPPVERVKAQVFYRMAPVLGYERAADAALVSAIFYAYAPDLHDKGVHAFVLHRIDAYKTVQPSAMIPPSEHILGARRFRCRVCDDPGHGLGLEFSLLSH